MKKTPSCTRSFLKMWSCKTFRIMRYTLTLLLITASFALAVEGYSQKARVSVFMENAPVKEVLDEIERTSEFYFLYSNKLVDVDRKVNIQADNQSIKDILSGLFAGSNVDYVVMDRQIVISPDDYIAEAKVKLQQLDISGKVTDSETGEPLPGVNVYIEGTTVGAVTDLNGNYTIEAPPDATLVFSFVGYTTQSIEVEGREQIDVALLPSIEELEEVVVVGYGTQAKRDLTGSVARANIESFRESPNVNAAQSLQGTVPGLNIGQVDEAGETPDISIRGRTTISGNQDVLIVLDGIIFSGSLSDLNPNDIESIDILKDASSMAIYGAQAANGVILITSREGVKSEKPVFNYTGAYTFQNPIPSLTFTDREAHIQQMKDHDWERAYLPPEYTEPNPDWEPVGGTIEVVQGYHDGTEFDWWEEGTQTGLINSHNLSVRGSQKEFTYFMAGGYSDQHNLLLNDNFNRKTARINLSNQILNWFEIGAKTFGSFSDYSGAQPSLYGLIHEPPIVSAYDENGELIPNPNGHGMTSPFLGTVADDFDKRNHLMGIFYADIDIPFIDGLNYRLNYGHNYSWDQHYYSNIWRGSTKAGQAYKQTSKYYDWTLDNILTYRKIFAQKHGVTLTLVAGRREKTYERTRAEGTDYSSLILSYNDLSLGANQYIYSGGWDESYLYQMGRLNYQYDSRYLLTATIRRDGFSGFAKNEKIALFPSVALGWVLSEEQFMDMDLINILKLRASWGKNGNLVDRYASLARLELYPAYVSGDGGSTIFGQRVTSMANPNLTWESTAGFNFGMDFSIINNRINGALDYYMTTTTDLIFDVNIPEITGFEKITSNVGEIVNRGIELQLGANIVDNNQFRWNIDLNLASNKNEIKSLIGLDADEDGQEDDLVASGLFIGESINAIYTYESGGIIQLGDDVPEGFLVGTHRIVDQNGDDFIDPYDRVIIGREEPAYRFGILNTLSYGNFELRFFINSVQGGKDGYLGRNMPHVALNGWTHGGFNEWDYWSPSNPDATWRRLDQYASTDYIVYMDRSFIRLQDVSLSYTLKREWINRLGIRNCKIFASGKNLITITDWIGWDPETGYGGDQGRPVLRGYSFGLDISF